MSLRAKRSNLTRRVIPSGARNLGGCFAYGSQRHCVSDCHAPLGARNDGEMEGLECLTLFLGSKCQRSPGVSRSTLADRADDLDANRYPIYALRHINAGSELLAEIDLDAVAAIDPSDPDANDDTEVAEELHYLSFDGASVVKGHRVHVIIRIEGGP